jgi:hypothetical protein
MPASEIVTSFNGYAQPPSALAFMPPPGNLAAAMNSKAFMPDPEFA